MRILQLDDSLRGISRMGLNCYEGALQFCFNQIPSTKLLSSIQVYVYQCVVMLTSYFLKYTYNLIIVSTYIQSRCLRCYGSQNNEVSDQNQDDLHQQWQSQLLLDDSEICCLFHMGRSVL